ncbi:MAG: SGNH/GDSL hydrolase family protein [Lentisphaeria bacterium]|nr:SGNH/GDSL hydrolase family protein [Lentisphaeria bacterium]
MKRILFQGDSITDAGRNREALPESNTGYGAGYPALVAARIFGDHLGNEYNIINRGISGNRVVDLYARWKKDCLNLNPDVLSILIGVNDTWHEKSESRNGVEVERYKLIYDMLLDWTVKSLPEIKLVLMEPFVLETGAVSADWLPEIAERGAVVKELAEKYNAVFIPCQQIISDAAAKAGADDLILRDGVHPSVMGHQVLADAWLKYAGSLI